jgi:electron transfer flavoprotein alpha subunit
LVFGEVRDGVLKSITKELVAAATSLSQAGAGPVSLALVGDASAVDAALPAARALPVAKVFAARNAALASYSSQGFAFALQAVLKTSDAKVVLFGATAMGRDLSARAAAHCDASLFTDCTELSWSSGNLRVKRPVYSGKVILELEANGAVQMASIRPNVFCTRGPVPPPTWSSRCPDQRRRHSRPRQNRRTSAARTDRGGDHRLGDVAQSSDNFRCSTTWRSAGRHGRRLARGRRGYARRTRCRSVRAAKW